MARKRIDTPGSGETGPQKADAPYDPNRTARDAYLENMKAIEVAIRSLREGLRAHRRQARADPSNWGMAGDLSYALDLIQQAVDFIGGSASGKPTKKESV